MRLPARECQVIRKGVPGALLRLVLLCPFFLPLPLANRVLPPGYRSEVKRTLTLIHSAVIVSRLGGSQGFLSGTGF
jgi:hypothetical protein